MKNLIKIISVMFLGLFVAISFANASEVGGNLNTGVETGIGGTVVVAPTANVPAGTYTAVQNVSLAAIGSQSVHYTTNGIDPTCLAPNTYSAPISISATATLKAIACYANGVTSSISSFAYVINIVLPTYALPVASPEAGTYTSTPSVALTATGSSSIHYTTDTTAPTCLTGTVYSSLIPVLATQTIKAIACYGENSSGVATFAYVINLGGGGGGGGGGGTPPAPTYKTGDINKDTKVNEYDFALMMADWGITTPSLADLNTDGKVDEYDFALLMLNWGL